MGIATTSEPCDSEQLSIGVPKQLCARPNYAQYLGVLKSPDSKLVAATDSRKTLTGSLYKIHTIPMPRALAI